MFTVAVFLPDSKWDDHPFDVEYYRQSYFELSEAVKLVGGEMIIVREQSTYQHDRLFSRGWKINAPGQFVEIKNIRADVVFNKSRFIGDNTIPIFNHPDLDHICTNKYVMYQRYAQFCPHTVLVNSAEEYRQALNAVTTSNAVVKPVDGAEGVGVRIGAVEELLSMEAHFPLLVQDFLDTSGGIPGIVEGLHDLRITVFDGDILYSYVRTPPPNKFAANVAQGGTFFMLEPARLPSEVVHIVKQIDADLSYVGPRFYSVDFGFTPNGPKIIEMNSKLGLLPDKDGPEFVELKQRLAEAFKYLANKSSKLY